jgi:hypothetical protein
MIRTLRWTSKFFFCFFRQKKNAEIVVVVAVTDFPAVKLCRFNRSNYKEMKQDRSKILFPHDDQTVIVCRKNF